MNANQKAQMEEAVRLAHATCCNAAGEADKGYQGHSHSAHMMSHHAQKVGGGDGMRDMEENRKMYDE